MDLHEGSVHKTTRFLSSRNLRSMSFLSPKSIEHAVEGMFALIPLMISSPIWKR